jgi:hypothetical protein
MRPLVACLLATAAIAACGGQPSGPPEVRPRPPSERMPRIVVTGRALPHSAPCRPRETARFVLHFLSAANRGDPRAADRFDPQAGPTPGWFSVTSNAGAPEAANTRAMDRPALAAYLSARHRQRERLRLTELRVVNADGLGQIEFELVRRAADLAGGDALRVEGKGAIRCDHPVLVVWSSSVVSPEDAVGPVCPRPARPAPGAVVACGRRG